MNKPNPAIALILFGLSVSYGSGTFRVKANKDNSIIIVKGERQLNHGRLSRIRIKGNQHIVALGFDLAQLKGKIVKSATLVCSKSNKYIDHVSISTIQCNWDEYKSNCLTSGLQNEAGWGVKGTRFPAVTGGNSFSLICQSKSKLKDDTYYWKVDPELVQANILGLAFGLSIHEALSDYSRNPRIYSRESGAKGPYLLLEFDDKAGNSSNLLLPPPPPSKLKVSSKGGIDKIRLQLRAPLRGFAYRIMADSNPLNNLGVSAANSKPLPRWNIPFVKPGKMQVIPIRDIILTPGKKVTLKVTVINRSGLESKPAKTSFTVPVPKKLTIPFINGLQSFKLKNPGIAIIPVIDKYDKQGRPIGNLPEGYRSHNGIFDGKTIRLSAARGEIIGFQALLKGTGKITVQCRVRGIKTKMFRALYVETPRGKVPDPLVPFDNLDLSQEYDTPVCVDLYVPYEILTNRVTGFFILSDGRKLPIVLNIRNFTIPKKSNFSCEMNGYGLPNSVKEFYRLQEIAYNHRVHCNILHYSHSTAAPGARKCNMDMVMSSGKRMNEKRYNNIKPGDKKAWWDDFVTVFGPYLSGKYFARDHRGPIPAQGFYLTFHESWPLNVRSFFNGNPDAYEAFKEKPVYAQTFINILKDFVRVAEAEGWFETDFQVYLNNKGSLNNKRKNPWILDEPTAFWDYRALSFYGGLIHKALGDHCPIPIKYRIDISRPQFDRGQLRGKGGLWVVNMGAFRDYNRLVSDKAEFYGKEIWVYGTSNRPEESSRIILSWALEAFRGGAKGVVPWQTINKNGSALTRGDQLGLFIFDKKDSTKDAPVIHHSMRLKAYRRAEQDIEYLLLLKKKYHLADSEIACFIDRFLMFKGKLVKQYSADAGTMQYNKLLPENFGKMREAVARLIEK